MWIRERRKVGLRRGGRRVSSSSIPRDEKRFMAQMEQQRQSLSTLERATSFVQRVQVIKSNSPSLFYLYKVSWAEYADHGTSSHPRQYRLGRRDPHAKYRSTHNARRDVHRAARTRARVKDLDQIQTDLRPENRGKLLLQPIDEDKPGLGQHVGVSRSTTLLTRPGNMGGTYVTALMETVLRRVCSVSWLLPMTHEESRG